MADRPAEPFKSVLDAECADLGLPGGPGPSHPAASAQAPAPASAGAAKAPFDVRPIELRIPKLDMEGAGRIEITGIVGDRLRLRDFISEGPDKTVISRAKVRIPHVEPYLFDLGRFGGKPAAPRHRPLPALKN